MTRRTLAAALLSLAIATAVHASWYDDYDAGLAAVRKGNWNLVVQKMSAAIKGNPKEGDRVRTYGVITANYHPYYYRGVGYLNTGRYEEAVADFERTSGPGPENLGSIDVLMERAKKQLAVTNEPEPAPSRPAPAAPVVTQPSPAPVAPAAPVPPLRPHGRSCRRRNSVAPRRRRSTRRRCRRSRTRSRQTHRRAATTT